MAAERARRESSLMEMSLQSGLGFADDSLMICDISSEVFETTVNLDSTHDRFELTNSITDANNWSFGNGQRDRLMSGANVAGRRFEKGIGLGQISEGLIEIKPVCTLKNWFQPFNEALINY